MKAVFATLIAALALIPSAVVADEHRMCACQISSDRGTNDAATAAMCAIVGGTMTSGTPSGAFYSGKYCEATSRGTFSGDAVYDACTKQKCGGSYCGDSTCPW